MSRVIVVTSGKGGVGKSSFCANVGSALAKINQKVCLIDADLGLKNLDVILGIENRVVYDIEDVIEGRVELRQALIRDKRCECLYVLPACKNINVQKVDFTYLERIINELNNEFDFIFIDCPAGIERGFYNAINNANEAIVVVNLDISSIRDADKVVGILNSQNINIVSVVVNRVNNEEKDVMFLKGEVDKVKATNKHFVVFYPQDAHMPSLAVKEPLMVKKAIFKILIK